MSWRTRHIRKRNKGKEKRKGTKRNIQSGGVLVEKLKTIIDHLIETKEEVSVKIGKLPATIKFIPDNKFIGVSGVDGTFDFKINSGVLREYIIVDTNNDATNAKIAGQQIVIDKLKDFETPALSNKKEKERKEKEDLKMKEEQDAAERKKANDENNLAIKTQEMKDTYVVKNFDIYSFMEPVSGQIQTQPYLEPVLNHLSHCIEKYFMGAISIENVIKFLKEFNNTDTHTEKKPTITPEEVKKKLQIAVDMVSSKKNMIGFNQYSSRKDELVEILKRLNAKPVKPTNKYSFEKECTDITTTCFFIKCIKYFKLMKQRVDADTTIEDIVKNGPAVGYDTILFVSDKKDVKTYLGCVCYKSEYYGMAGGMHYVRLKFSNILKNENSPSEHKDEISKLTEEIKLNLKYNDNNRTMPYSMHINNSFNEYVDKEVYEIENAGDDFTSWTMIPTASNIQTKVIFQDVIQNITTNVSDVIASTATLYSTAAADEPGVETTTTTPPSPSEEITTSDVTTTAETTTPSSPSEEVTTSEVKTSEVTTEENPPLEQKTTEQLADASPVAPVAPIASQNGGGISIDLQKHPELKEFDNMIKSLPLHLYNNLKTVVHDTIDKINNSNATPDTSFNSDKIKKIIKYSDAIKGALKTDIIKQILPDIVKEEEELSSSNVVSLDEVNLEAVNSEAVNSDLPKEEAVNSEAVNSDLPKEGAVNSEAVNSEAVNLSPESKMKIKESLQILLNKLKEKYSGSIQKGGSVSSILETVLQKHPELENTNIKELLKNVPEDVASELNVEDILTTVSESDVKVDSTDPFITDITTDISSTSKIMDDSKLPPSEQKEPATTQETDTTATTGATGATQETDTTATTATQETSTGATAATGETATAATTDTTTATAATTATTTTDTTDTTTTGATTDTRGATATQETTPEKTQDTAQTSSEIIPETDVKESPPLTLDDLKISPTMKNNQSNEMGKYVFVPEKMVQLVIDYLLSNGCEISTTVIN